MLSIHDRASMARALTLDLQPQLKTLLAERINNLPADLIDYTAYLVVEPGDTEEMIKREVGFSPLVEPIDGIRYGQPGFQPYWDWLQDHDGVYEMIVTFGSTFAYVLLILDVNGTLPQLLALCAHYA